MDTINKKAYAKINLGLDILGKRADGYHEVRMIMQMVDIFDLLNITKRADEEIVISTDSAVLPGDENNLIYKAAKKFKEFTGITQGVCVHLTKNIPIAAGMAGGSTDAAAALVGLDEIFRTGVPVPKLMELGKSIGADVPYCILGKTALAEGIGERLTPLPAPPPCYLLIAKPDVSVSTKFVYENLRLDALTYHPDIDGMLEAIEKQQLHGIAMRLENVLETVTVPRYPLIETIKNKMREAGAMNALMSGSGPTVFGIFETEETARQAKTKLAKISGLEQLIVTKPYNG